MTTVGERLRAAREARGLTLEDVEAATKIRAEYLDALEHNNVAALPNPVVARGFLRNYARFLDLDPEPLVAELLGDASPTAPVPPIRALNEPLRRSPVPLNSVLSALFVIFLIAGLSLAAWYIIPRRQTLFNQLEEMGLVGRVEPEITVSPTPVLAAQYTPQATPSPSGTPRPTATPTATPVPTATRPPRTPTPGESVPVAPGELRMTLQIVAPAWLLIVVDGEEAFMGTLEAGETREWVGRREIFVRTGNAGGVRLIVNGQDMGLMGGAGQVLNRLIVLDDQTGQPVVVEPTPTPVPTTTG